IEAEEDAEIAIGTKASSREEFEQQIKEGKFQENLRKIKVKPGDFYFIPAGTIHSIGAGIMAYETMQSSDVSYRVYDYDRKLNNNEQRTLNVSKA
ncbi:class I mannose-6-phosphate isomerase, partial [Staphylococcus caprae]